MNTETTSATMGGLVFLGGREVELRQYRMPTAGPGEVVVKLAASGMCGSDLHVYRGASIPAEQVESLCIAGHEPAGTVFEVGPGVPPHLAKPGDRVMVHHYSGCTVCQHCRSGWPQMCSGMDYRLYGTNEHGAHAPYMKVPAVTLVPLDDALSFEAGAAIGCGTGTAWGGLLRLGNIGGAWIVVSGQGPVGLSATMLATARGAKVIAVDMTESRLRRARDFGAAATLNAADGDVVDQVRTITGGAGSPFVLETSGASAAVTTALDAAAPWGRICLVGLGGETRFRMQDYLTKQLTVMTSWSMSLVEQERCAQFVVANHLPVDDIFTHRWTLEQAARAYEEFDKQDAGKGVFVFD